MLALNPSDIISPKPSFEYITYSYEEGISKVSEMIVIALVFALISMIISLIIGVRRKDCLAILVVNVMIKTVTLSLYLILDNLPYFNNLFIDILLFLATLIIEGIIYKKILKYKKHNGMTISIICNIGIALIIILMDNIWGSGFIRL